MVVQGGRRFLNSEELLYPMLAPAARGGVGLYAAVMVGLQLVEIVWKMYQFFTQSSRNAQSLGKRERANPAAARAGVGMYAAVMVGRARRSAEAGFADCTTTSCGVAHSS